MDISKFIALAKRRYDFAKYLNQAYAVGKSLLCLIFTKEPIKQELMGGSMVVINTRSLKSDVLPVRPQTLEALKSKGDMEKIFSVVGGEDDG